jgi:hypothetical protein
MSDLYSQLLEATIQYLETLKNRGVRFVSVAPSALSGLTDAHPRSRPEVSLRAKPIASEPKLARPAAAHIAVPCLPSKAPALAPALKSESKT